MCVICTVRLTLTERDHAVVDARGRRWIFEMHPWCGPIVLTTKGDPIARQPGSRSPFWPAFEAWQARRV